MSKQTATATNIDAILARLAEVITQGQVEEAQALDRDALMLGPQYPSLGPAYPDWIDDGCDYCA